MKVYKNENFPYERALYAENGVSLYGCSFSGEEDGESALKECRDVKAENCSFDLRYPFWHVSRAEITGCKMNETCRAAIWYGSDVSISDSKMFGIKAIRECERVKISDCEIVSPEFGWKSADITIKNSKLTGEYPFFLSRGITADKLTLNGKYSFQYISDSVFTDCLFETKDAFWHAKNVTVKNSVINGEYFSWYSENLTLENCKITGTQPLCYCKGLKLINCRFEGADFAFEYSEVEADMKGHIISVKNPLSGHITADSIGEIILDGGIYDTNCEIKTR